MTKINFTFLKRRSFLKKGFSTNLKGKKELLHSTVLELPCEVHCDFTQHDFLVGMHTYIGEGSRIDSGVKIGRFCSIGRNVKIGLHKHPIDRQSTRPSFYIQNWKGRSENAKVWNAGFRITPFDNIQKPVKIGDDVLIGEGVFIMSGVTIGEGAVVLPGSVVVKDIPAFEIHGGNPAVKIKKERKVQNSGWAGRLSPKRILILNSN